MPASKIVDLTALILDFVSFWLFAPAFIGVEHLQMLERPIEKLLRPLSGFFLTGLPNFYIRTLAFLGGSFTTIWLLLLNILVRGKVITIPEGWWNYLLYYFIAPLAIAFIVLLAFIASVKLGNWTMHMFAALSVDGPSGEEVRLRWARVGAVLFIFSFVFSLVAKMIE